MNLREPIVERSCLFGLPYWFPSLKVWSPAGGAVGEAGGLSGGWVPVDEIDCQRVRLEAMAWHCFLSSFYFLYHSLTLPSVYSQFLPCFCVDGSREQLSHEHLSCKPLSLGWLPQQPYPWQPCPCPDFRSRLVVTHSTGTDSISYHFPAVLSATLGFTFNRGERYCLSIFQL